MEHRGTQDLNLNIKPHAIYLDYILYFYLRLKVISIILNYFYQNQNVPKRFTRKGQVVLANKLNQRASTDQLNVI